VDFANACNSAQSGSLVDQRLSNGSAAAHDFAGGLLEGGVRSFIDSQWPLGDDAGVTFAEAFYRELAAPGQPSPTIGGAVRAARRAVIDAHGAGEPAWAGYVHYGRPWQVAL
jgi:CHAT domain-containing protein